jgi:hypothetical protein
VILSTKAGENVRIQAFLDEIQVICNTSVWGSEEHQVRWTCPYDTATKTIMTICLDNVRTRKVINALDCLVDVCIPEEEGRDLWKETLELYREAMLLLLIREDLSDEQIFDFQWKVNGFAQGWFKINKGDEGVTKYIHDLHAGHISDYSLHWRNLNMAHLQQGWENMNFAIKRYWFWCTNRGGSKGSGNHLQPLARWVQRCFVWMMGFKYEQILAAVKNDIEADLDNIQGMDIV